MTHFTVINIFRLVYVHKGMSVQNMEPSAEQFRIASLLDEKKFDAGTRLPADISKQYKNIKNIFFFILRIIG